MLGRRGRQSAGAFTHTGPASVWVTQDTGDPRVQLLTAAGGERLVAKHFQSKDHSVKDMEVTVIEQIHAKNDQLRKTRERFWRHKLRTNYPQGLNVWD